MRLVHYNDIPTFKARGFVVVRMLSNGYAYVRKDNRTHDPKKKGT